MFSLDRNVRLRQQQQKRYQTQISTYRFQDTDLLKLTVSRLDDLIDRRFSLVLENTESTSKAFLTQQVISLRCQTEIVLIRADGQLGW